MKRNLLLYCASLLLVIEFIAPYYIVDTIGALYYVQNGDPENGIAALDISWILYVFAGILAFFAFCFVVYFFKARKKKDPLEIVEFKAPEGFTPAEVGCLVDGVVDNRDVSSLLIYWASQDCIKIEEVGKAKKEFKFIRLKDLPSNAKKYEQDMFKKLFSERFVRNEKGENIKTFNKEILLLQVGSILAGESQSATAEINDECHSKYFKTKRMLSRQYLFILTILTYVVYGLFDAGMFRSVYLPDVMLVSGVILLFLGSLYYLTLDQKYVKKASTLHICRILILMLYVAGSAVSIYFSVGLLKTIWIPIALLVLGAICLITMGQIEIRNEKGLEILGKILGLRNFIKLVEKDRIEKLVKDDPKIFYEIMPYAYVLGVSDTWIKQFNVIKAELPVDNSANIQFVVVSRMLNNVTWQNAMPRMTINASRTFVSSGMSRRLPGGASIFGGRGRRR